MDKQGAAGTFKGSWGHHPLTAWCDNTGESLARRLRPGNAGSNTASDHIEVLTEAITQIPARHRRDLLITRRRRRHPGPDPPHHHAQHRPRAPRALLGRVDLDQRARIAIGKIVESDRQHVTDRDGEPRDLDGDHGAGVVELTGLLRTSVGGDELGNWPADMRILCRRERPSSGAQLCALEETDGWRYQLFAVRHEVALVQVR